ncbi:DUF5753 domain-containing protein [Streptomyces lydicus]|uniref:DUF5753 domain-containing protein n=1 Tax=Streptomyces lydicus TaxID=47763 RepID=UPI00379834FF
MTAAYEPSGWDKLRNEGVGPTQLAFLDLVRKTKDTKHYAANVIWGNIQTPDYARAMLRLVVDFLDTPKDIEAGVAARTARADLIGTEGRSYHVIIGHDALRANIGGPEVMRGQLARLLESFEMPGLKLGIIPDRTTRYIYPGHSFGIFDSRRVEIELFGGSLTYTERDQVDAYEKAFGLLERSAVYGDEAKALISAELDALRI